MFEAEYTFAGVRRWNLGWTTPNYAGIFVALLICLWWGIRGPRLQRLGLVAAEIAGYFVLCKTYSRGALVALAAGAAFFLAAQGRRQLQHEWRQWLARLAGLVAVLALTGFYHRVEEATSLVDRSVSNRLELWRHGLQMIHAAPWSGWGQGNSGWAYMNWFQPLDREPRYATMVNGYLELATAQGLPAFALIIGAMAALLVLSFAVARADSETNVSAAAGASLLAWLVGNIFTTLWVEPRLWIVPGCAMLVIVADAVRTRMAWAARTAAAFAGAALVTATGYVYASTIERLSPVRVMPGEAGNIIAVRGLKDGEILGNADPGHATEQWHVWADEEVLGPTPGKEIRRWLLTRSTPTRAIVHPAAPFPASSNQSGSGLILFGRHASRAGNATFRATAKHLWIVHPTVSAPTETMSDAIADLLLVLPAVDETGTAESWREWAQRNRASIMRSSIAGTDIRFDWPGVIAGAPAIGSEIAATGTGMPSPSDLSAPRVVAGEMPRPPSSVASGDRGIATWTGMIKLDGTLRLTRKLSENLLLKEIGLLPALEHTVACDADGGARSRWVFKGMKSSLVTSGRREVIWTALDGTQEKFARYSALGQDASGSLGSHLRITAADECSIECLDGTRWRFRRGLLVEIIRPGSVKIEISGRSAWIESAVLRAESGDVALIRSTLDAAGRVGTIWLTGSGEHIFRWSATGELRSWQKPDGNSVRFSYREGLLSNLAEPGRPSMDVQWGANAGSTQFPSYWPAPVHLVSAGPERYEYAWSRQGFVIVRLDAQHSIHTRLVYNPWRRTLVLLEPQRDAAVIRNIPPEHSL